MTFRPSQALLCALLCLTLAACGGGSDNPSPPPKAMQLNADNMMDAVGVATLAQQRAQVDATQLLNAVFVNYFQQLPAGTYACAASGSITLARPSPLMWTYTAQSCDTGEIVIKSGQLQIDASLPSGQGLKFQFTDAAYRASAKPAAVVQTATGVLTVLINVNDDLGKRTTGNMAFTSNGRADTYSDIFIASKNSDEGFVQYGVSLKTPRFAYALKTLSDLRSQSLSVQADDGSSITVTTLAGGTRLELRASAGAEPSLTKTISSGELEAAIAHALQ